jgi:hypothetical protein
MGRRIDHQRDGRRIDQTLYRGPYQKLIVMLSLIGRLKMFISGGPYLAAKVGQ